MSGGINCYPGTDVLVNKYGIREKDALEKLEIQKVAVKLLRLDVNPCIIPMSYNPEHLLALHLYLFGDIYEWAGTIRKENIFKAERVLSGGSAEYADYREISHRLEIFFQKYVPLEGAYFKENATIVAEMLQDLWSIHPFREGNTRTCVTYLWLFLYGKGVTFHVELLKNNALYVRDALVMANYGEWKYLLSIVEDALMGYEVSVSERVKDEEVNSRYKITKTEYESFRSKYYKVN